MRWLRTFCSCFKRFAERRIPARCTASS